MSSRRLRRLRRTLGFRLALGYSALFILSATILFGVAFFLVSSTFRGYDLQILHAKLNEYAYDMVPSLHLEESIASGRPVFWRANPPRR